MKQLICIIVVLIIFKFIFDYFQQTDALIDSFNIGLPANNKSSKKIKIGILLNYTFAEIAKIELYYPSKDSPEYINNIPKHFLVRNMINNTDNNLKLVNNNILGFPNDLVIGYCIKWLRPDIEVNFITPDDMSVEEFKKNDLVFILIYDLLEALNVDNLIGETNINFKNENYLKLKYIFENVDNIYPSYEYQKLINSKCDYYTLLEKNGIPIIPFRCFRVRKKNVNKTVKRMISYVEFMELSKSMFITKLSSGLDGIGFMTWEYHDTLIKEDSKYTTYFKNINELAKKLEKYLTQYNNSDKILVQKMVQGFGEFTNENVPYNEITNELKTYYIGDSYKYSIIYDAMGLRRPIVDGGSKKTFDCKKICKKNKYLCEITDLGSPKIQCQGPDIDKETFDRIQKLNKKIFKILPPIIVNNKKLPRLLTRLDVGIMAPLYNKSDEREIFLNEIEYIPSLMLQFIDKDIIKMLSKQIINITEIYLQ